MCLHVLPSSPRWDGSDAFCHVQPTDLCTVTLRTCLPAAGDVRVEEVLRSAVKNAEFTLLVDEVRVPTAVLLPS